MGISTAISSSKFIETVEKVIYEWLTDGSCFDSDGSLVKQVHAGMLQDAEAANMTKPWCEFIVTVASNSGTGAGALKTEAVFKHINVEIGLRSKRPGEDFELIQLGDILDNYFRSSTATLGRKGLGGAGIRRANLVGPFDDDSKNYYLRRWFLTGRVLVSNE